MFFIELVFNKWLQMRYTLGIEAFSIYMFLQDIVLFKKKLKFLIKC